MRENNQALIDMMHPEEMGFFLKEYSNENDDITDLFIKTLDLPEITADEIIQQIESTIEEDLLKDENIQMIFLIDDPIERQKLITAYRLKAKEFKKARYFDDLLKVRLKAEEEHEKEQRRAKIIEFRKEYPNWFAGDGIDEVLFCNEYRKNSEIKCINGQFYNIDGFINEDKVKNRIQSMIRPYINSQLAKNTESLLKALKNECYFELPPLNEKEIHLKNGVLKLDGVFAEETVFCLNRLNVIYQPHYKKPEKWCTFLKELLNEEDVLTLQEYLGYCLIPSTRAQTMLFLIGNGGEGKSRIGTVLKEMFGASATSGSLADLENDKHSTASIENKLIFIDDDLSTEALKDTKNIKRIVTAEGKIQINQKFQPIREAFIYSRLLAFGNTPIKSLYDNSDGFFRRQIIIKVKPKPVDRVDDKNLIDKLLQEKDMIFQWMFDGLQSLILNGFQFTLSEQTKQNMEEVKEEACNVISFLKDPAFITFGNDFEFTSQDLYYSYEQWSEANGDKPLAKKTMLSYLKINAEKLCIEPAFVKDWEKKKVRGFKGLKSIYSVGSNLTRDFTP